MQSKIILIVDNVRSAHNVGSLLRTAEGLGIQQVILGGYTPYPLDGQDQRLPHIAKRTHAKIQKTALGAELTQAWSYAPDLIPVIHSLKQRGYEIIALEQTPSASDLIDYKANRLIALVVGNEVSGVSKTILDSCNHHVKIPMQGVKESFNVVQATAMALFYLRYML